MFLPMRMSGISIILIRRHHTTLRNQTLITDDEPYELSTEGFTSFVNF